MVSQKGTAVPLFRKILNLYVYSSIHIGLCAFSYSVFGQQILHQRISYEYAWCICFSTIALYCIHRLLGISKMKSFADQGRFSLIIKYKKHIEIYFLVSLLLAFLFFIMLPALQQFIFSFVGLYTLTYAIPIFKGKRIRDFNYIKIALIAITWTFLCIAMPFENFKVPSTSALLICNSSVFFFIGLTIPFDIRDIKIDRIEQVKTLATRFGKKRAMKLSYVFIFLSLFLIGWNSCIMEDTSLLITWLILSLCTIIIIYFSAAAKNELYYSLLMDGIIGSFYPIYHLMQMTY